MQDGPDENIQEQPKLTRAEEQRQQLRAASKQKVQEVGEKSSPSKLGGPLHWMVFGLAVIKDVVDVVMAIILPAIALVPVVGLPAAGAFGVFNFVFGMFILMTVNMYFWLSGGSSKSKQLARTGLALIIEIIPEISILPLTTIMFLSRTKIENLTREKK